MTLWIVAAPSVGLFVFAGLLARWRQRWLRQNGPTLMQEWRALVARPVLIDGQERLPRVKPCVFPPRLAPAGKSARFRLRLEADRQRKERCA